MAKPNRALIEALAEADWSPRALGRAINRLSGPGTIAETAPYYWRDAGGVPHRKLMVLAAQALSHRLGRTISITDLWPGSALSTAQALPAIQGLDALWTRRSGMITTLDGITGEDVDQKPFAVLSGAVLLQTVDDYLARDTERPAPTSKVSGSESLVALIEQSVPLLQRLDDSYGGASYLNYVGAQVGAVSLSIRDGGHSDADSRRLFVALSDLSQLAGWMAIDASQHSLAQRYLFLGLSAARSAGYPAMVGHIIADLSFHRATQGDTSDAVELGQAAVRAAGRATGSVRASILSRLAYAYAAAGRTSEFEQTRGAALDALDRRDSSADPTWMYYLTENHLTCQSGYALVGLGRQALTEGDKGTGRAFLRRGESQLRTGAHDLPPEHFGQRRALFEGAWLALGYSAHGKYEEACATARVALSRLRQVRSPRSVQLLEDLARDLRRRKRNPFVRDLLPELESAVARARVETPGGFTRW